MAAALAPLLSIVIFSGRPCCPTAFLKKTQSGFLIAMGCQQEVDGVPVLVDGALVVFLLALDLDVGLVLPPAVANSALLAFPEGGL